MREYIPLTGTSFELEEYQLRQQRVLHAIEGSHLDAMIVTAQSHLRYLTGYSGAGAYFAPFPLLLTPGQEPTFIVREFDEENVRANSCISNIVAYSQTPNLNDVFADTLRRHGLHNKRVGMELGCWSLAPNDVLGLQARLEDIKVVDASKIVPKVAAVKSETEMQCIREAAVVTDTAIKIFNKSLRVGITETEVAEAIRAGVEASNATVTGVNIAFGERLRLPHADPANHPLRSHDGAFLELSGVVKDYCSPLCRSAVVGGCHALESLHKVAEEAIEAAVEAIRPGVTTGEVSAAIRSVVDGAAHSKALRSRTGYQIGTYWTDRGDLSIEPNSVDVIERGMTFHMPIILFTEEGYQTGCSESVVVHENGAEVLSKLAHTLHRVKE